MKRIRYPRIKVLDELLTLNQQYVEKVPLKDFPLPCFILTVIAPLSLDKEGLAAVA